MPYFYDKYTPDMYAWNGFLVALMVIGLSSYAGFRYCALAHPRVFSHPRAIFANIIGTLGIMAVFSWLLFALRPIIPGYFILPVFAALALVAGFHLPRRFITR